MKKILSALLACSILAASAGCAGGNASSGGTESAVSSAADSAGVTDSKPAQSSQESAAASSAGGDESVDYSTLTEEEIYERTVKRSLLSTGDMTRMANVLKRAKNGGNITAAYIGGSITEGYNAGTDDFYAKICTDWLQEKFPDAKVTGVNAGISGTPSLLGNLRLERDVLASEPDIVFVEFAVNDGQGNDYKAAYESLVRTLLTQDKDIAVVLLFTILKNGYTCQEHMSEIGAHYGLPMISVPDSIGREISEGRMAWEKYSNDESHPNAYGHACIRDFAAYYYEQVIPVIDEKAGTVDKNLPAPKFSGKYANMHYTDNLTLKNIESEGFEEYKTHNSFQNGWRYRDSVGGSMKFRINCSVLEMVYKANNKADFADAEIYVDGNMVTVVRSNRKSGWNNPETVYLIDKDSAAEHEVEIRVNADPEGTKTMFYVLAFGYCD